MINNYLRTFGVLKIEGALDLPGNIEEIYDEASEECSGESIRRCQSPVPTVMSGVERNPKLTKVMLDSGILEVAKVAFGESGFMYWGSDLSTFKGNSDWHRDACNDVPIWKIGIYLNGSYDDDQIFYYIPGSHHVSGTYSDLLGKSLKWPYGAGLNTDFFQGTINPKAGTSSLSIPACGIKIKRGDVIVFDQRILHAVASNSLRRLIAMSFYPSVNSAAWQTNNRFLMESDYLDFVVTLRCASQIVERNFGRKTFYGQKDLPIKDTDLWRHCGFKEFSENDLEKLCQLKFPNLDKSAAFGLIDKFYFDRKLL
jgi:hypothetical protein